MQLLEEAGLVVPPEEISFGTTLPDSYPVKISYRDTVLKRVNKSEGFKVLGTMLTFDNRNYTEMISRIAKAWRAFGGVSEYLKLRKASLKARIRLLDSLVTAGLLWGASPWNIGVKDRERLRGVQRSMIRKMIGFR